VKDEREMNITKSWLFIY